MEPRVSGAALAWISLVISVIAMSSGGVWFALMKETPPMLKASWRLTLTSMLQSPAFVWQWALADVQQRRLLMKQMPLMLVTGALLAVHFDTWAISVSMTSLAHSLLWVCTTPFVLISVMAVRYLGARAVHGRPTLDHRKDGHGRGRHGKQPHPHAVAAGAQAAANESGYRHGDDRVSLVPSHTGGVTLDGPGSHTDDRALEATAANADGSISSDHSMSGSAAHWQQPHPFGSPIFDGATDDASGSTGTLAAPPTSESRAFSCSLRSVQHWAFPPGYQPPTVMEVAGVVIGTIAAAVLAFSHTGDQEVAGAPGPTLQGDLIAFVGAVAMAFYLNVGFRLRKTLPLFLYAFPVTACSAVVSSAFSLLFERQSQFIGVQPYSLFGWFGSGHLFGLTFGAAFGAGILGHTLCNYALGSISSLIVSVLLLLEPVIGSLMGYVAGVQGNVGPVTGVAGVFLIIGAAIVTVGDRDNMAALKRRMRTTAGTRQVQASTSSAALPPQPFVQSAAAPGTASGSGGVPGVSV